MSERGPDGEVDYAVPTSLPSARVPRERRVREADGSGLWGGRGRTALKAGCWVAAALLSLPVVVPLLAPSPTGADSPEAAVEQLLQGLADLDVVAIVGAIDPVETADRDRADAAYGRLSSNLVREGEVPAADVTAVLAAAEAQVGGEAGLTTVATIAALDLELDGLRLTTDAPASTRTRVYVDGGSLDVTVDPGRLPDGSGGIGAATYAMPLAEGWRAVGAGPLRATLVTVERDGRWYVSLEATGTELLGPGGTRG